MRACFAARATAATFTCRLPGSSWPRHEHQGCEARAKIILDLREIFLLHATV